MERPGSERRQEELEVITASLTGQNILPDGFAHKHRGKSLFVQKDLK